MLAFRSEAHVDRWCALRRLHRGAVFTLEQAWQLGLAWYADKLSPDWRRATPSEAESACLRRAITKIMSTIMAKNAMGMSAPTIPGPFQGGPAYRNRPRLSSCCTSS